MLDPTSSFFERVVSEMDNLTKSIKFHKHNKRGLLFCIFLKMNEFFALKWVSNSHLKPFEKLVSEYVSTHEYSEVHKISDISNFFFS